LQERRVETGKEAGRLMLAEVERSPGARALAQVNGQCAEPSPPLPRRAAEIEGNRRMRVELRPAPSQGSLAKHDPSRVEVVSELAVAVERERQREDHEKDGGGDRPRNA
jgi:hypothetical protein